MSTQKECVIAKYGIWDGGSWVWNLHWRREFFHWETLLFSDLQVLLQQFQLVESVQDKVCWQFHSSRCFTVKGFQEEYYKGMDHVQQSNLEINKVQRKLAPPKAELFMWLVFQGRINTKVRLQTLNLLSNYDTRCVFCNQEDEEISHLLFNCIYVWRFWCRCYNMLGVQWVISNDPNANFDSWLSIALRGNLERNGSYAFMSLFGQFGRGEMARPKLRP